MKNLSEKQVDKLAELTVKVRSAEDVLNILSDEVNRAISKLNAEINEYNRLKDEVGEFVEEVTSEIENYADNQSTEWSESDAGSNYEDWKNEWEGIDLDQIDRVEEVIVETTLTEALEGVATEPSV